MRKLRGAIIGYGFISGKGHAPAYLKREDVEIVAIADIAEGRRQFASETLPKARIYSDYRALLDAEAGNLDFVDVSTPPCDHDPVNYDLMLLSVILGPDRHVLVVLGGVAQARSADGTSRRFGAPQTTSAIGGRADLRDAQSGHLGAAVAPVTLLTGAYASSGGYEQVRLWTLNWKPRPIAKE